VLDGIFVEVLVDEAPAVVGLVVLVVVRGAHTSEQRRRNAGVERGMQSGFFLDAGAGGWVVDDGLEHGGHGLGWDVALALYDLRAVGGEDDSGRPAIVLVAIGDVGAGVLIDFDENVLGVEQADDGGIAVGVVVHDVAPVAPHGFEVEQDEFVLLAGL